MDKIVITSDHQCRYVDWKTHRSVVSFIEDFQPNLIVLNGDLLDLEAISHFPTALSNRLTLSEDLRSAQRVLQDYREAAPDAEMIWTWGNHEERMTKYLRTQAPELEGAPGLTLSAMMDLDRTGTRTIEPYGEGYEWHSVLIYHGSRVSSHSGQSARAEYFDAGTSGVSGHTQRLGAFYYTDRNGAHAWYEGGCMCRIDPAGAPPSARGPRPNNWQQGFVWGYANEGVWNLYQTSITRHKFIWNGKLYTPNA